MGNKSSISRRLSGGSTGTSALEVEHVPGSQLTGLYQNIKWDRGSIINFVKTGRLAPIMKGSEERILKIDRYMYELGLFSVVSR